MMFPQSREYKDLSYKEQHQADQITVFCYDLLDLWGTVLAVKFEPMNIRFFGGSFNNLDHFAFARWVIDWQHQNGWRGGLEFTIYPLELEKPEYKMRIYRQVVNACASMIWDRSKGIE